MQSNGFQAAVIYHHASLGTLPGLAFRQQGSWLFLPMGDGPLHPVEPTEALRLQGEMPRSMTPVVEAELLARRAS